MNSGMPSIGKSQRQFNRFYSHFYAIILLNIILSCSASGYVPHKHHTYGGMKSPMDKPVNYDDFSQWDNWVPRALPPFPMLTTTTTRKPTTTMKTTVMTTMKTTTSTVTPIPTVRKIVPGNSPADFTLNLMTISLSHVVFCLVTAVIIFVLITFVLYCLASMSIENERDKNSQTTSQVQKQNSDAEEHQRSLMDHV
ncbi:hypothetical protein DdX_11791 [Ditylenchus destructor]|uniref:Uncharacterized protein n=1 Tax=Ditylenchus destructor TaxID=166010 RepID=A0AAD4MZC2_9BILA|nr:hypothetical protein DdX_11791 [Ditylenchus destructor]